MSALLAADYRDRTIKVLEDLRDVLDRRYLQALHITGDKNASTHERDVAFGNARAYSAAIDDVARAIQKEQGR